MNKTNLKKLAFACTQFGIIFLLGLNVVFDIARVIQQEQNTSKIIKQQAAITEAIKKHVANDDRVHAIIVLCALSPTECPIQLED